MREQASSSSKRNGPHSADPVFSPPQLNVPKGGGAIRGIGEKFAANPVSGTGSLSVPIATSPGRAGFGPQLSLSYDSGAGNGPFGFGWSLSLPSITRKTDKGLPRYLDADELDTFILSGAEDLVPLLIENGGQWTRDVFSRTVHGQQYAVHRYRPRVESSFARIERWANRSDPHDTFWRAISKDNVTTWYGKTAESRIADPADPTRIFSWLICESYDDKGNVIAYHYKAENSDGVDLSQAHERNRSDVTRSAARYLKNVLYGNRTPYFPDLTLAQPIPLPTDWCFELVFDYGEHDDQAPVPQESGKSWDCRLDPFSSYRSTFEVRTYRLCRRALMFHHFPNDPTVGQNCLVRSTDFTHSTLTQPPADPTKPFYSFLRSITQTGYRRTNGGYLSKLLPPLEFEYSEAMINDSVQEVDPSSLENLPDGLDGSRYQWVDLDGEGTSGILTRQGDGWFYKANLSPAPASAEDTAQTTLARFGAVQALARQPSLTSAPNARQQFLDLDGDGHLDVVELAGPTPGFFERTAEDGWASFKPFPSLPILDWTNPNLKLVDLTGDGLADLLISDDDCFWWHPSQASDGYGPGERVPQAIEEERGPKVIFADGTDSIFLADMSGDGLSDIVRVRNGEVCYWPNLGYGRFGPKVSMDQAPWFETSELFDGRRVQLADIDGSGTADIIYVASSGVHFYFNQSGNAWGTRYTLSEFPSVESVSSARAVDLLGNGTACLVWSSPLPDNASRQMRYVDLMGGQKPHLLVRVANNLGAETRVAYAPSTKFYVADKLAGTPWVTRVPFPVHVVEHVTTYDYVSRNLFVTRYAYHHGYYDGVEREFRGFGRVDQWDTEEFATLTDSDAIPQPTNLDADSHVPPVLTKSWFHTGAFFGEARISKHFEHEYYHEGDPSDAIDGLSDAQLEAMLLDDTLLPSTIFLPDGSRLPYDLSPEEAREACRALRGSMLRQEIYALDGTNASDRPYSTSESNDTIEMLQPQGPNRFAAFFTHPRETIDFHYERKLFKVVGNTLIDPHAPPPNATDAADPRVAHTITLAVDPFGNVPQAVSVAYGRRFLDPALTPADQAKQGTTLATCLENTYTNAVLDADAYRVPLLAEASTYELIQVQPDATEVGVTNLFRFAEIQSKVQAASDGQHDVLYENLDAAGIQAGQPYRRLIERTRTLYRPDDLGVATGDPNALLPLGTVQSLALPGTSYRLAFTPGLLSLVYQRSAAALLPAPANVLGSTSADGGGYVNLDGDGHWWISAGRVFFTPAPTSAQQEGIQARQHFFQPRRFVDPFGNPTRIDADSDDLLVVQTVDAVNNTTSATNDYRVLQPSLITDPNGNRAAVSFDVLGMVAGLAVMGKTTENLGDSLDGFPSDLSQQQVDDFYDAADPHTIAAPLLGGATTRTLYDVGRFARTRAAAPNDPTTWQPAFAATITRETHVSDLAPNTTSKLQIEIGYSDGFGREIQKKVQAEPGPVSEGGPTIDPRWIGSGWTIFNNKGKPVRQYEPFFSQISTKGHQFEFGIRVGVSPILCYDPVERVIATIHPNHTYEKVVFDPWRQDTWDVNDAVQVADPTTDPDVGPFFSRLPKNDYWPTWDALRTDPAFAAQAAQRWPDPKIRAAEAEAATKAAAHAGTPTVAYVDTLGRTFLTIADNATAGKYPTHVALDIEGNQRAVTDALGRVVMRYDYDMLGNRIHQASMEAGERWILSDVLGKPIRAWDSRGHDVRTTYDALRRPTGLLVRGHDTTNSDPRTLNAEILVEKTTYGEGQPNDQALNLRTRAFQHHDTSGVVTSMGHNAATNLDEAYDFRGNLLRSSRQLVADYKALPDWSGGAPVLQTEIFNRSTRYDALNRPIAATTPDGSVIRPTYNAAKLLEHVEVNLRGAATATSFIANIDYNAKGQRVLVAYGNNTITSYVYDPETFRLSHLTTTRTGFPTNEKVVQDLAYVFDPDGNITHIQDDADIQNVVFFRNQRVEPSSDYTYDAIYRLVAASGREHLGQSGAGPLAPVPTSYNDIPRVGLLHPGDGSAMGTYREQYQYDAVGNIAQVTHQGTGPINPGWTRAYSYNEASLLEPGKFSNRLTRTVVSPNGAQPQYENYSYDPHGSMTTMPQLQIMEWDFKDQLRITQRQAVNAADDDGAQHQGERTYDVYDGTGQRIRKVTERQNGTLKNERIYLGSFEVYREYNGAGTKVTLERETLHVLDDKRRIALVETKTIDASAPGNTLPSTMTRYQLDNHLGSACLELDEAAAVISYEEYYPFGSTSYQAGRSLAEVGLKRYRYTGKERDDETGLYYHGARYYAPWLGRWVSCDPAGLVDGTNLFVNARDNPITRFDRTGRQSHAVTRRSDDSSAPEKSATQRVREHPFPAEFADPKSWDAWNHQTTAQSTDQPSQGQPLSDLLAKMDQQLAQIDQTLSAAHQELNDLQARLDQLQRDLSTLEQELARTRQDLQALDQNLATWNRQYAAAQQTPPTTATPRSSTSKTPSQPFSHVFLYAGATRDLGNRSTPSYRHTGVAFQATGRLQGISWGWHPSSWLTLSSGIISPGLTLGWTQYVTSDPNPLHPTTKPDVSGAFSGYIGTNLLQGQFRFGSTRLTIAGGARVGGQVDTSGATKEFIGTGVSIELRPPLPFSIYGSGYQLWSTPTPVSGTPFDVTPNFFSAGVGIRGFLPF